MVNIIMVSCGKMAESSVEIVMRKASITDLKDRQRECILVHGLQTVRVFLAFSVTLLTSLLHREHNTFFLVVRCVMSLVVIFKSTSVK